MANEGADNERIREALDAALDELDSDNEEGIDERPNKSEQRSATTANIVDPIDPSSPEALLESFIGQMMVNGNEDELLDKVMGEMEAHIHSAVSQQEELSAEIPPATSQPSAAMSANPTNASDSFLRQPQSSSKRKHSCEPPPSLDAVIGNLFEEIASENEKLDRAAAMEGSTFRPPGISEDDPIMQNLMKELEGLKTNDLDTDSVIDGMMEQLLSKDLMYQPMKQVAGRFPSWLDANKSKLSESEYIEREKQCGCFQRLVAIYESDPSNTTQIMDVMQEVQEYGQPPTEIIREIAPGIELNQDGLPMMEECNIM